MQVELVAYSIRRVLEDKIGAKVYPTYPPRDASSFDASLGDDYHKYIVFTQAVEVISKQSGATLRFYLYYRNKRTIGLPEFSSCEFGIFTGRFFTSLFKHHIEDMDDAEFADKVCEDILKTVETI